MDERQEGATGIPRAPSAPRAAARPLLRPVGSQHAGLAGRARQGPRAGRLLLLPLLVRGPPAAAAAAGIHAAPGCARLPVLPGMGERTLDARLGRRRPPRPDAAELWRQEPLGGALPLS